VAPVAKPVFTVQVRELIEFALRGGDLGGRSDFVGADRALAGTRGHQRLQRSRPAGYQKEVPVSHEVETDELILRVQGRIDGLLTTPEEVRLEEIKTIQGTWDRTADPLHWAQAKCYGFIYATNHALEQIALQLTYLHLETGEVTEFGERFARAELSDFFATATAIYVGWIRDRRQWRQVRDQSIHALGFPFPRYRTGQRELAVAAYRALAREGRLFIEAPTGIGKTMAVLFPALKAMAEGQLERIFYLTARTVGRTVAEKGFTDLRRAGLRLQSLTLTAKEKICAQPGPPCDPGGCPRARGYYDRVKPAMREALAVEEITRPVLERVSRAHQVCPFELSLDVSNWVDAIICDYNYVFDPEAYLRRHFAQATSPCAFLVDEAHNLVDRGREMFSADLSSGELRPVQRAIKDPLPRCARALGRLSAAMRKLCRASAEAEETGEGAALGGEMDLFADKGSEHSIDKSILCSDPITITRELPAPLPPLVDEALKEAEGWLARNEPAEFRPDLLELYFRLRSFRRTAQVYDERFVTMVEPGPSARVRLFCLDPSLLLQQALDRGRAALFFSATLTPREYYQALLGGRPEDRWLPLTSPFPPEHLAVLVHDRIRTQLKARAGTLREVAEAIGALVQGRTGNYLVYLSSYQYLTAVQEQFHGLCPEVAILAQRPGMAEPEREAFLEAFAADHAQTLVGFAVLGGVFGEGIDLVGERLIGAVIVGVGLPQLCAERGLIQEYFQEKTGAGFDFAYTFPGMNRVLQATGRVIRSEADRGVVLLIDTRFAEPRYRRLFPATWRPERVRSVSEIEAAVRRFWQT
jgi:DNA excision repair protein ERCC-2